MRAFEVAGWLLLVCASGLAQGGGKAGKLPASRTAHVAPLSPDERAAQMLSRFTFGARPGDLAQVETVGTDRWFAQQLAPDLIHDDVLNRRLDVYPTLRMRPDQILNIFPERAQVQQVADGKRPYPTDPLQAAVYQVKVYKLERERTTKAGLVTDGATVDAAQDAQKLADQATADRVAGQLFAMPKQARMAALIAMPVPDRIAFVERVRGPQRDTLVNDFNPAEREAFRAMGGGIGSAGRAGEELSEAHLVRAVLSERQLQEVMTDFWFNHFNVYLPKESDQWYTTAYERDVIRPHALGHFGELLLATAESPAMMVYLDNLQSVGPDSPAGGGPPRPNAKKSARGLNENYGRELMELHTLGVNGGYTQADVTALAAILTGWGVDRPGEGGPFRYDPKRHEPGTKEWFGYTIDDAGNVLGRAVGKPAPPAMHFAADAPDGMRQGLAALAILAAVPETAHFICYALTQRFVADEPPPELVETLAATYAQTDGDMKAVLRTLVASPEFNSRRYFRNKVKTPLEFVASAFRATATDPTSPGTLVNRLRDLGQPPYGKLEPTGYPGTADHWMNTAALVKRLNFADDLTHNRLAGQRFDAPRVLALGLMNAQPPAARPVSLRADIETGPNTALRVLETTLVGGEVSANTDRFVRGQMLAQPATASADTLNLLTTLLLGSPEFQVR